MSNTPSWLSRWGRSPRQDRRVVEDGKFVELGKIHVPEPPPEPEQEQPALEIVQGEKISGTIFEEARYEPVDAGASAETNVQLDGQTESAGVLDSSSGQVDGENRQGEESTVVPAPDPVVPTPENVEEPFDAVAEHEAGSLTVSKIAEAVGVLPGPLTESEWKCKNCGDTLCYYENCHACGAACKNCAADTKALSEELSDEESDALAEVLRIPEPEDDPVQDR